MSLIVEPLRATLWHIKKHKMRGKSKRYELLILLMPVLGLLGLGTLFYRRDIPTYYFSGKPRFYNDDAWFGTSVENTADDGYVYVRLWVDHYLGLEPNWWGKTATMWIQSARFIGKDGNTVSHQKSPGDGEFMFHYPERQYEVRDGYVIPKSFLKTNGGRFEATIGVLNKSFPAGPVYIKVSRQIKLDYY
jgi:hypothetical protein